MTIFARMNKSLFLFSILWAFSSFGQDLCDSLIINQVTVDAFNPNQLNITVLNESTSEIFNYPGFRVYDENNNLIGEEEVFFFGIGGESTHAVSFNSSIFPFDNGNTYSIRLELWINFYDSMVCEYDIETVLVPSPIDCVPVQMNFIEFSQEEVSYSYTLFDFWNNILAEETLVFSDDVGNITRNFCIDASCYFLQVTSSQPAEESNMVINMIADENAGFLSETLLDNQEENTLPFGLWTDCSLLNNLDEWANAPLLVFPNPVQDEVRIDSEKPLNYRLFSLHGQLLLQGRYQPAQAIDLSLLEEGLYLLECWDDDTAFFAKLIKE